MPRLPVLKTKELAKVLIKIGFVEHHRSGSHVQFKHIDGRRTTVSLHAGKDVPNGTLRAIISDIDMTVEDFIFVMKS